MSELFRRGGPHKVKRIGSNRFRLDISIPNDADGLRARECPSEQCSPAFFKVRPGTGIVGEQAEAFCPYCRHANTPRNFPTKAQVRYAHDIVKREAHLGVQRLVTEKLGLDASGRRQLATGFIGISLQYKPSALPPVARAAHEELRRDVICPHCGLDQSVYGLATWCADCGRDIFLTHVDAEFAVVRRMLTDVDRRRESLGPRIAAKDLENCLEDVVTIHEAVLKSFARKLMTVRGKSADEIDTASKKIGNAFQNADRSSEFFLKELDIVLLEDQDQFATLKRTFQKRHPITHNLGIVDRKYLEQARTGGKEGHEVRVTAQEIDAAMKVCTNIFCVLQSKVAPPA